MLEIYLVRVKTLVTGTMVSIITTDIAVTSGTGADINAVTLMYMCHLFGFMKECLQEGGVSTDSAIGSDSDTQLYSERTCFQMLTVMIISS